MSDGVKSFYCLADDKCITVWKKTNGQKYIILGRYEDTKIPSDNYIIISKSNGPYIDVIFTNDKNVLIGIGDDSKIVKHSSNGLIQLYEDNKPLNDSLYTYLDGKYRKYRKETEYLIIDIQENYATDKNGKKLR